MQNYLGAVANAEGTVFNQGGAVSNYRGTVQNDRGRVSNYGGVVGNSHGEVFNASGAVKNIGGAVQNVRGFVDNYGGSVLNTPNASTKSFPGLGIGSDFGGGLGSMANFGAGGNIGGVGGAGKDFYSPAFSAEFDKDFFKGFLSPENDQNKTSERQNTSANTPVSMQSRTPVRQARTLNATPFIPTRTL